MDGTRTAFRGTGIWLLTVWMLTKIVPWVAAGGPDACSAAGRRHRSDPSRDRRDPELTRSPP